MALRVERWWITAWSGQIVTKYRDMQLIWVFEWNLKVDDK